MSSCGLRRRGDLREPRPGAKGSGRGEGRRADHHRAIGGRAAKDGHGAEGSLVAGRSALWESWQRLVHT